MNAEERRELIAQFDTHDQIDPDRVPDELVEVMEYIRDKTGLLGDYNQGIVKLANAETIQWYPRGRIFSAHDDLLHWIQEPEQSDVIIAQCGTRLHPDTDETTGYIEIHPTSRWNANGRWDQ